MLAQTSRWECCSNSSRHKLYGVLSVVYSVCDCALSDVRFSDTANSCQSFFEYCTFLTAWCHARPFHTLFSVGSFLSSTRMCCPQCLFYVCSFLSLGTLSSTRNTLLTHCLVRVPWCFTPNFVFHQTCAVHSAVWCMFLIATPPSATGGAFLAMFSTCSPLSHQNCSVTRSVMLAFFGVFP